MTLTRRKFVKTAAGVAVPLIAAPIIMPRINGWIVEEIYQSLGIDRQLTIMGPMGRLPWQTLDAMPNLAWLLQEFGANGARWMAKTGVPMLAALHDNKYLKTVDDVISWFGITQAKAQLLSLKFGAPVPGGFLSCGTTFPDATMTGVAPGTVLTASGSLAISTNGTTVSAKNFNNNTNVTWSNVTSGTMINCLMSNSANIYVDVENSSTGVTVTKCTFTGGGSGTTAVILEGGSGTNTVSACNVSDMENGFDHGQPTGATILNNYVHDLFVDPVSAHTDGIQSTGGFTQCLIQGNSIFGSDTSCIIMQNEGAAFSGYNITGNLLVMQSGSAAIIIRPKNANPIGVGSITNNRLGAGLSYNDFTGLTTLPSPYTGNEDWQTCATITTGQ